MCTRQTRENFIKDLEEMEGRVDGFKKYDFTNDEYRKLSATAWVILNSIDDLHREYLEGEAA